MRGTAYYYTVCAINAAGCSAESVEVTATTTPVVPVMVGLSGLVNGNGIVTTIAGGGAAGVGFSGLDGTGAAASFNMPKAITIDATTGNLYVVDYESIRKVTPMGVVTTTLAIGTLRPEAITVDTLGNLYVTNWDHTIRKITPAGVVTTIAGSGSWGNANGTGVAAKFNSPTAITIDATGNLYVADAQGKIIRKITPTGAVTTLAGGVGYHADGTGAAAGFCCITGIAVDATGNLYVADGRTIRMVTPTGVVTQGVSAVIVPENTQAVSAVIVPTNTQRVAAVIVSADTPVPPMDEATSVPGAVYAEIVADTPTSEYVVPTDVPYVAPSTVGGGEHWIDVDLSQQRVYAYAGDTVVNSFLVSTGVWSTPTVTGQFHIWTKLLATDMSGPGYYLPDVPYTMYFYKGYGLHGTYWHHNFGTPMSHGCVNLATPDAEWLYNFSSVGTLVNVHY